MLRHVAVFRWAEGTPPADVDAFAAALAGLPAVIPEIRSYRFGPDAGLGMSANADFAVVADFDDAEGYAAYATPPGPSGRARAAPPAHAGRAAVGAVHLLGHWPSGAGRGIGADRR